MVARLRPTRPNPNISEYFTEDAVRERKEHNKRANEKRKANAKKLKEMGRNPLIDDEADEDDEDDDSEDDEDDDSEDDDSVDGDKAPAAKAKAKAKPKTAPAAKKPAAATAAATAAVTAAAVTAATTPTTSPTAVLGEPDATAQLTQQDFGAVGAATGRTLEIGRGLTKSIVSVLGSISADAQFAELSLAFNEMYPTKEQKEIGVVSIARDSESLDQFAMWAYNEGKMYAVESVLASSCKSPTFSNMGQVGDYVKTLCEIVLGAHSLGPLEAMKAVEDVMKTTEGGSQFSKTRDVDVFQTQKQECVKLFAVLRIMLDETLTLQDRKKAANDLRVIRQKAQRRLFSLFIASLSLFLLGYVLKGKGLHNVQPSRKSTGSKGKAKNSNDDDESGEESDVSPAQAPPVNAVSQCKHAVFSRISFLSPPHTLHRILLIAPAPKSMLRRRSRKRP